MSRSLPVPQSTDQLHTLVNQLLCERERLEPDFYPLTSRLLTSAGEPCGLYFCLFGPRKMRLSAVWDARSETLLCYDSRGVRFHCQEIADGRHLRLGTELAA